MALLLDDGASKRAAVEKIGEIRELCAAHDDDREAHAFGATSRNRVDRGGHAGFPPPRDDFPVFAPREALEGFGIRVADEIAIVDVCGASRDDDTLCAKLFRNAHRDRIGGVSRHPTCGNSDGVAEVEQFFRRVHDFGMRARSERDAQEFGIQLCRPHADCVEIDLRGGGRELLCCALVCARNAAAADHDNETMSAAHLFSYERSEALQK